MLISKEVEMTWTHSNKKYFIEKGYNFDKYGSIFNVKVEDLTDSSMKIVKCKCDYCNEEFDKKYSKYLKSRIIVEKDACQKCSNKKQKDVLLAKYGDKNYNVKNASKKLNEYNSKKQMNFFEKLTQSVHNKNYVLMPYVYTNARDSIGFICNKHKNIGVQFATFYSLSKETCNCKICNNEAIRERQVFSYKQVKTIIESNGRSKLLSNTYTKSGDKNLKILCYECQTNTFITSFNKFCQRNHIVCKDCRKKLSYGETSPNWRGGITDIRNYLRTVITPWKIESLKNANFMCDITGECSKKLEIHHAHKSFKDIVDETFKNTKIPIKRHIGDYTNDELQNLSETCINLHYKYGLGICMKRDYHLQFHNIYGRFNNTLEQYLEFKSDCCK